MACRAKPVLLNFFRRLSASAVEPNVASSVPLQQKYFPHIGNREIVGFGICGTPNYMDDVAFPYPSIRFRNNTPEMEALLQKEKGPWNKLTKEEMKTLYRHSFCQTLAEVTAPNHHWASGFGWFFLISSIGLVFYLITTKLVITPKPSVIDLPEYKQARLYKEVFSRSGSVGTAYQFDIENMRWRED